MRSRFPVIITVLCCLWLAAAMGGVLADAELNSCLSTLNATANLNYPDFKANIRLSYNITEAKFDYLAVKIKMAPADIYMTVRLAMITKTSVDKIAVIYQRDNAKGWGRIAQDLGIKPGSAEFKALKVKALEHSEKIKNRGKSKEKGNGKHKKK